LATPLARERALRSKGRKPAQRVMKQYNFGN